ncbi:MAG TPA: energy transducer TonB, partial [Polyangiaceae bacterium]|nr:energy transducer TonB [Polyangiaceae bacterium]
SLGLERWRPALENYVANVKPGNQTALNTARVPFARYLNQIHQRLHELFADHFLGHLDQLPKEHPLNNQEMSTHLEIALSREDGRVVRMGITKSSGVTAFDVGALDSVERAAPYGPPPSSILSSDGNVYLHWEFHRRPEYACSTYFARPFIIDLGQTPTVPSVEPPKKPGYDNEGTPPSKSGALERQHGQPSAGPKLAQVQSAHGR